MKRFICLLIFLLVRAGFAELPSPAVVNSRTTWIFSNQVMTNGQVITNVVQLPQFNDAAARPLALTQQIVTTNNTTGANSTKATNTVVTVYPAYDNSTGIVGPQQPGTNFWSNSILVWSNNYTTSTVIGTLIVDTNVGPASSLLVIVSNSIPSNIIEYLRLNSIP